MKSNQDTLLSVVTIFIMAQRSIGQISQLEPPSLIKELLSQETKNLDDARGSDWSHKTLHIPKMREKYLNLNKYLAFAARTKHLSDQYRSRSFDQAKSYSAYNRRYLHSKEVSKPRKLIPLKLLPPSLNTFNNFSYYEKNVDSKTVTPHSHISLNNSPYNIITSTPKLIEPEGFTPPALESGFRPSYGPPIRPTLKVGSSYRFLHGIPSRPYYPRPTLQPPPSLQPPLPLQSPVPNQKVHKHFSVHLPFTEATVAPKVKILKPSSPYPKEQYSVIFIKAPSYEEPHEEKKVLLPPPPAQKTIIYLLSKAVPNHGSKNIQFVSPVTPPPLPPEVYFVKYRDKPEEKIVSDVVAEDLTRPPPPIPLKHTQSTTVPILPYKPPKVNKQVFFPSTTPAPYSPYIEHSGVTNKVRILDNFHPPPPHSALSNKFGHHGENYLMKFPLSGSAVRALRPETLYDGAPHNVPFFVASGERTSRESPLDEIFEKELSNSTAKSRKKKFSTEKEIKEVEEENITKGILTTTQGSASNDKNSTASKKIPTSPKVTTEESVITKTTHYTVNKARSVEPVTTNSIELEGDKKTKEKKLHSKIPDHFEKKIPKGGIPVSEIVKNPSGSYEGSFLQDSNSTELVQLSLPELKT